MKNTKKSKNAVNHSNQQKTKKKEIKSKINYPIAFAIIFIIVAFILSFLYYNDLPNSIITHWGINGNADGYAPKEFGLFFLPVLLTGIIILLYFLPKIDPLRENINEFRTEYHTLIAVISGFFLYIQIIIIIINLGMNFDIRQLLAPAFAVLIYSIGALIKKTKRNYFIGIRTPWTISSDLVWSKTHKKAGALYKASAILCLIGLFIPEIAFFFIIVPLLLASLGVIIYSYIEYKKEEKANQN
jgi:uncharacterized membrane protein